MLDFWTHTNRTVSIYGDWPYRTSRWASTIWTSLWPQLSVTLCLNTWDQLWTRLAIQKTSSIWCCSMRAILRAIHMNTWTLFSAIPTLTNMSMVWMWSVEGVWPMGVYQTSGTGGEGYFGIPPLAKIFENTPLNFFFSKRPFFSTI